ncbi:MAG: HIT domain-containing protein [Rhizobiaceae bacterium]
MNEINPDWQLDSRLRSDTFVISETNDRILLLMNDKRWPWMILVPKVAGAEELHDLPVEQVQNELLIATLLGETLKSFTHCEKINIAAIGNSVRQLHIHIVARQTGDANWPAPVWGYGTGEPYSTIECEALLQKLKDQNLAQAIS